MAGRTRVVSVRGALAVVVVALVVGTGGCSGSSPSDPEVTGAIESSDPEVTGPIESTPVEVTGPIESTPVEMTGPIESTPGEDVPSALSDPFHPDHPQALVELSEIVGVVPADAIPALEDPAFEPAAEVQWLAAVEPVLALEVNGDARAYPLRIMTWHELVNGTVGGVPVTVSYCPLCNSGVAYDRRAGDRILDFGTSGALLNSALVMYDRQTESLWSHYTGQAVVGHLTGTELDLIPVQTGFLRDVPGIAPRWPSAQSRHRPFSPVRAEPLRVLRLQQPSFPVQRLAR